MTRTRFRISALVAAALLAGCSTPAPPLFGKTTYVGQASSSPGWGFKDQAGYNTGFDFDLANWLGDQLGFTSVPVDVLASNRESQLQNGLVNLVVATYSITDPRREKVDFAGPYMVSHQGVMVRSEDRDSYHKAADLLGKSVCVTTGSTSEKQVTADLGVQVTIRQVSTYEECRTLLREGKVDALSTDQLILYGIQHLDKEVHVPPDIVFGQEERYGIGLPKGSRAKCEAVRAKIVKFISDGTWYTLFKQNLPDVPVGDHKPDPSQLDPCV
ncbi:transporter substrate-binding domain-containing protein [Lentzea sp.]|uniref:transporter substrate-binding domain-containing protein n=1 Tax=Lentzea sp. TaxID=56099 RepID=UPI002ED1F518